MNRPAFLRPAPLALATLTTALLTACGGGDSTGPAVTNLAASPPSSAGISTVAYGKPVTLSVSGSGLNSDIVAVIEPGCFTMTRSASTSDSTQTFTCTIRAVGDLRVRVRTAEGRELASLRLDVPMPQVAMVAKRGNDTGSFVMELDPVRAPKTVDNFLTYVNTGSCFYKGTLFHRVIANFMSQAGGFNSGLQQVTGQGPAIELESKNGLSNLKYTVAMARTNVPNSATSEFFINAKDNLQLDYVDDANPGYAVFGKLISGMEAVDVLNQVPTMKKSSTTNGVERIFDDAPIDEVMITACGQTR